MKKFKIPYLKLTTLLLIVILSVYCINFGIKKALDFEIYKQPESATKVYSIWHIETFEGGSKPRINYLKTVARSLEKENKGVLFAIKQIEPTNLSGLLQESKPDIVSFGFGVGKDLLELLSPLNFTYCVRDELVESGSFNNSVYALPYIVSGYAIINQNENSNNFICGTNAYIHPEKIYSNLNFKPLKIQTQYEAYKDFANGKNYNLLGTARDVFRVENLNKIGRKSAQILPIEIYTDLIQFLSVINLDETTEKFVKTCLVTEFQSTLKDYNLFSSLNNKLYSNGIYNDMENAIMKAKVPCVFYD